MQAKQLAIAGIAALALATVCLVAVGERGVRSPSALLEKGQKLYPYQYYYPYNQSVSPTLLPAPQPQPSFTSPATLWQQHMLHHPPQILWMELQSLFMATQLRDLIGCRLTPLFFDPPHWSDHSPASCSGPQVSLPA
jgi:hypothetical protein